MNDTPLFVVYFLVGAIGGVAFGVAIGYSYRRIADWADDWLRYWHIRRNARKASRDE